VNLPRPPAEVQIVVRPGAAGEPSDVQVNWQSLTGEAPSEIRLGLDGAPLPLDHGRASVRLPAAGAAHVLSAELRFAAGVEARQDVVLTGDAAGDVATELTAVPVRTAKPEKPLAVKDLQGRFTAGGRPLAVAAVERGPAQVFVVRAPGAERAIQLKVVTAHRGGLQPYGSFRSGPDLRFRFVAPAPTVYQNAGGLSEIFDVSPPLDGSQFDLAWLLGDGRFATDAGVQPELAAAVAVAGVRALGNQAPRAVVLLLDQNAVAPDLYDPAAVRGYLAAIGVPLFVWSLEGRGHNQTAWGEVDDVSTSLGLRRAYSRLEREVERQQIVWLQGRHLPQSIALTPAGSGGRADLELVSAPSAAAAKP
jgi:hypothetical protein